MKKRFALTIAYLLLLSSCASEKSFTPNVVTIDEYDRLTYSSEEIGFGDLSSEFSLDVVAEDYRREEYFPALDELTIENCYVKKGDMVKKGDLLVSFKADDLAKQLKALDKEAEDTNELIKHYEKLADIEGHDVYSDEIGRLKEALDINSLKKKEVSETLENYNIRAEDDGIVSEVWEYIDFSEQVSSEQDIVTVIYGTEQYKTITELDRDFKVGERFDADYAGDTYSLELTDIRETEEGKELTFKPFGGGTGLEAEHLQIKAEGKVYKDVLYTKKNVVFEDNGKSYVYVLGDDGYRRANEVKAGDVVDDMVIIEDGLKKGDRVVMPR